MRHYLVVVGLVVAVGCNKKKAAEPGAASGSAPGSAVAGSGSAVDSGAPVCDLAGSYRIRFRSNGADGWWLRWKVEGTPPKATISVPQEMLGLAAGPIDAVADPVACRLTLSARTEQAGDVKLDLSVDPATSIVTGELTRTKNASPGDSPSKVRGAVDRGAPLAAADACFAPAIYELVVDDGTAKWKNEAADDDRSCKDPMILPVSVRVELLGPDLAIDYVQTSGEGDKLTVEDTFGDETVTRGGPCEADVKLQLESITFEGKLTFTADGTVSGTARTANVQIVEDGEEGEGLWNCVASDVAISGKRLRAL